MKSSTKQRRQKKLNDHDIDQVRQHLHGIKVTGTGITLYEEKRVIKTQTLVVSEEKEPQQKCCTIL